MSIDEPEVHMSDAREEFPPLPEGKMRFTLGVDEEGAILFRAPDLLPGERFTRLSPGQALQLASYLAHVAEEILKAQGEEVPNGYR